uniref:Bridging integrator 3 n=1 Tax=Petromyzon marinus TaxID=7757 RepID=S4RCJ0_PETMA
DSLVRFSSVFPSLNVAVKRREQALQECKKLQAKLEKYEEREKTGPNIAKTHQSREEMKPVREEFEQRNKALLEEMPQLYTSRADYFQPSFEALVRSQVNYYAEVSKIFRDLSEKIDVAERTDEQREQENEARLAELRSLSIVAND